MIVLQPQEHYQYKYSSSLSQEIMYIGQIHQSGLLPTPDRLACTSVQRKCTDSTFLSVVIGAFDRRNRLVRAGAQVLACVRHHMAAGLQLSGAAVRAACCHAHADGRAIVLRPCRPGPGPAAAAPPGSDGARRTATPAAPAAQPRLRGRQTPPPV